MGTQGCTPGFWKQTQHFQFWCAAYTPDYAGLDRVTVPLTVGCNSANLTLLQALSRKGRVRCLRGEGKLLADAGVSALLNSCSVDYPLSTAQIISEVNTALASCDRTTMISEASRLDGFNNASVSAGRTGSCLFPGQLSERE